MAWGFLAIFCFEGCPARRCHLRFVKVGRARGSFILLSVRDNEVLYRCCHSARNVLEDSLGDGMRWHVAIGMIAGMLLSVGGCSQQGDRPPLGTVTGTVTLDGKPFPNVMVLFKPQEGRAASGLTDSNGRYELEYLYKVKGCKVGPCTVSFMYETGAEGGPPIPEKYGGKSALSEEVLEGSNTFDFDLISK
jgi:hypothetical protein